LATPVGTRIGPYEIESLLGAGGMGEVYRAVDSNLGRHVAVKVLPEAFTADSERIARFEREARTLAALNHPNVAHIYGFERSGAAGALVMELVEGPTLADRLAKGPMPPDEALAIARQIADGLEAAHEKGIVHRDLKPSNIKITADGTVKLLDFGLAKGQAGSVADLTTLLAGVPDSTPGVVMGTFPYMSPEQARGKSVDARSDIWAFGCVLYEMLTGRRTFDGETSTDIVAKILTIDPDWQRLPTDTPASARSLLRAALNKDTKQRLQHIGDIRLFLNPALFPDASTRLEQQPARHGRVNTWMVVVSAVLALIAAAPAWLYFRTTSPAPAEMQFEIAMPGLLARTGSMSISRDGQLIAYVKNVDDVSRIVTRPIGALTERSLPGTEGAVSVFWAPDNHRLAFVADGKLKKIDVAGGPPQVLADTSVPLPGDWSSAGAILFAAIAGNGPTLTRTSEASGATSVQRKAPTSIEVSFLPEFLPDQQHFLYIASDLTRTGQRRRVQIGALSDDAPPLPAPELGEVTRVQYVPPGFLLFLKDRTLMAQPFDAAKASVSGEPRAIADDVGDFTVSDTGILIYGKSNVLAGGFPERQLLWFDRQGHPAGQLGLPGNYVNSTVSPDGRSVAVSITRSGNQDIHVIDIASGADSRLTFEPGTDAVPVWSSHSNRVMFVSRRPGSGKVAEVSWRIYVKSANGVGPEELIFDGGKTFLTLLAEDWSADGRYVVIGGLTADQSSSLWTLPLFGDKKPVLLARSVGTGFARISPDGKWIAYASVDAGENQIVVQSFPDPANGMWQITTTGGTQPNWRPDGRELFYLAPDGTLMAVPVTSGDRFEFGKATPLFKTRLETRNNPHGNYVTADGQRFLFNVTVAGTPPADSTSLPPTVTVVVNWLEELK